MADHPELGQLLAMSRDRTAYQNPLFQAVTQMAYSGLPTYARQGTQLSGSLSNQAPPAQASGGGMNPALAGGLGALGGAALNSLGPNGNALGALIEGLKKLFGHTQGVQGNKPYSGGALTGGGQPAQYPFPGFAGNEGRDPNQWDPFQSENYWTPPLTSDPGVWYGENGGGAQPSDPSGGTGVGPGMQGYYNGLYPVLPDPGEE